MDGKAIVEQWRYDNADPTLCYGMLVVMVGGPLANKGLYQKDQELIEAIDAALAQTRAEENEACAAVAAAYANEHTVSSWDYGLLPTHDANMERGKEAAGIDIAEAIRARRTP